MEIVLLIDIWHWIRVISKL